MDIDVGGFFLTAAYVRSGQVVKVPASMVAHHVDKRGEYQVA
jgi:hypothetical protein